MWETDGRTFEHEASGEEYRWLTPCGTRVAFKLATPVAHVWRRIDLHERICEVCNP